MTMDRRTLGRTGLEVSAMGVGTGGGLANRASEREIIDVVRSALDCGVNYIDTAESYRTEEFVGAAIRDVRRDSVVLSTKMSAWRDDSEPADLRASLEGSLRKLGTDYVDVYNLHGVGPGDYDRLAAELVPELQRLQQQGKIRFIGVTELFGGDSGHAMLEKALADDVWDVVMVGLNMLNQSAREHILPKTIERNVGVQIMFAVRRAFSNPARLREIIDELIERGQLDPAEFDRDDPFGFLIHDGGAVNLPDAAYRFCRDEPGVHVVLAGTGNLEHLTANIETFARPPLPQADRDRLAHIFRRVDSVSGS